MTEIPPPPPPAPDPRPFGAGEPRAASGCQKPLLIGCGLLTLLLGIGAIVFVLKAKDVLAYAMDKLRAQVVAQLPEELSDADRDRLEASFGEAVRRIRAGEIDPTALQGLQQKLASAAQSTASRRMSVAELKGLQEALDLFNGVTPPAGATPAPAAPAPAEPSTNG